MSNKQRVQSRDFQTRIVQRLDDDIIFNELARRNIVISLNVGMKIPRLDCVQMEKYDQLIPFVASQWAQGIGLELTNGGALKIFEVDAEDNAYRGFLCMFTFVNPQYPTQRPADKDNPAIPATELLAGRQLHPTPVPQNLGQDNLPPKGKLII